MPISLLLAALLLQAPPTGVIEGTVVDETSGQPLRRVAVVLTGQRSNPQRESALVVTTGDGRFRFESLDAGAYSLTVRKSGYLIVQQRQPNAAIQLAPGGSKTGITLKLTPQAILSGRVFDEEGDPVQLAQVQVYKRVKVAGNLQWQHANSGVTNDRGEYRVPNLAPGAYAVSVTYRDALPYVNPTSQPLPPIYATTYYPNSTNLNSAQAIAVQAGAESAGIDLHLRREAAFRVRIRVDGVAPELLRQTNVRLEPRDSAEGFTRMAFPTRQSEPGLFELSGVPAGAWYVLAQTFQQGAEPLLGITPVDVTTADLPGVVVRLGPMPQLTGTLAFDPPPATAPEWKAFSVRLVTPEGASFSARSGLSAEGAFAISYLRPGPYRLNVQGPLPPKTYLASIQAGDQDYLGKPLDLTSSPPGPIRVIFRNDAATLGGTLDAAPDALSGTAVLVPVEPHLRTPEFILTAPIGPTGAFQFPRVRPGQYLLCHMAAAGPTLAEEGEPPKQSLDAATPIKLEPNAAQTAQLKAVQPAQN